MAMSAASRAKGFLLIGVYTLGYVIPFLLAGLFTGQLLTFFGKHRNVVRYTAKIGGALMLLIGAIIGPAAPWVITGRGLLILFVLIMISAVCFAIYNELLAWHPISKIAIYNALIPVLGVIFAALILKEELKWQYFISVLMVAAGIYLVNREKRS